MSNQWLRVGDYYQGQEGQLSQINRNGILIDEGNVTHEVYFVTEAIKPVIVRIDVQKDYCNTDNLIKMIFSPFYYDELKLHCQSLEIPFVTVESTFSQFCNNDKEKNILLHGSLYEIELWLDKHNFLKIMQLFDIFNSQIEPKPFSAELIAEINNIYLAAMKNDYAGQHIILALPREVTEDDKNAPTSHRPRYESLADEMAYNRSSDKWKSYLIEGDNPNERQQVGLNTPLTYALLRQDTPHALELLLWYGANPFKRSYIKNISYNGNIGIHLFSAIELALMFNQTNKANLIVNEYSHLINRPTLLTQQRPRLNIINSYVTGENKAISSYFHFNNKHCIKTTLKPIQQLTQAEREVVLQLVKANFEAINDTNHQELTKIFNKDFSGNKLIDVIYDNDKVVGFNLLEIINLSKTNSDGKKQCVMVHCAYAAIEPAYRGYGLMVFLSFRLAYILQAMMPDKLVGIFFCAAHYNSYRMVNFKHSPKYQTETLQSIVHDVIKAIFGENNVQYFHQLLKSYIVDNLRVKSSSAAGRQKSLNERMFTREIMDQPDETSAGQEARSAPVTFFVGDDNYKYIYKAAHDLGIEFGSHIKEFANVLKAQFPHIHNGNINLSVLMRSADLFFKAKPDAFACNEGRYALNDRSKSLAKL